ncbi:MAG TPA: hypothetical protein VL360_04570 [Gammaproteobacteria bacterium]|jgi:hypothetical protein|nr:hypothetical protein [Gammaproteobacteria bacterium]
MLLKRSFALLIMTISSVTQSEFASARMHDKDDFEPDILMRVASSSFHPVVQSFESQRAKPAVHLNNSVKARSAKRKPSSKVNIPESKSFATMIKPAKAAAKKTHVAARKKKTIVTRNKKDASEVKKRVASKNKKVVRETKPVIVAEKQPVAAEIKKILYSENVDSKQQKITFDKTLHGKSAAVPVSISKLNKPVVLLRTKIDLTDKMQINPLNAENANLDVKKNEFDIHKLVSAARMIETADQENALSKEKPAEQIQKKFVTANAFIEGKKPANANIQLFTTAKVNADPDKVDAAAATHSIFISQPSKRVANSMPGRSIGVVHNKPVEFVMPVDVAQQAKKDVQSKTQEIFNQQAKLVTTPPSAKNKIINNDQIEKQQVVKIVTADVNRDDFYILGENDPVPSQFIESPTGEMVVMGGNSQEADKKIMEFKLAAIQAARAKASKELAEKESTAKVLAELAIDEQEARARLAAAQKAIDDMEKLKRWQKEKQAKMVDKVVPSYTNAIVTTVVPEKLLDQAQPQKNKVIIAGSETKNESLHNDNVANQSSLENIPVVKQPEPAFRFYDQQEKQAKINKKSSDQITSEKQLDTAVKKIRNIYREHAAIKTASKKKRRTVARKSFSHIRAKRTNLAKSKRKSASVKNKVIVNAVPSMRILPDNPRVKVAEADKPIIQ